MTSLLKEDTIRREELRNYLEGAAKQSERLGKLIANLFELTKLGSAKSPPSQRSFPLPNSFRMSPEI